MSEQWFEPTGGQCNAMSITVPLRYAGPDPLVGAVVTVDNERVTDIAAAGMIFDDTEAELGDLRPGAPCVIMLRTDGTPGPLLIALDVKVDGSVVRRLTIESTGSGRPKVTEHSAS